MNIPTRQLKIAIDFDGTIVENRYPGIGKEMLFAFETMKELQAQRHFLILWTYRDGKRLQEAVDFCKQRGIEFWAVNKSYPEEQYDPKNSPKVNADIFIDDRNIGGFIGWPRIFEMIKAQKGRKEENMFLDFEAHRNYPTKGLLRKKLKSLFK